MKRILLPLLLAAPACLLYAQKKQKQPTAYAITAMQKGQSSWTEVRLVNLATGEELKKIYQSSNEVDILNARTGKAVVKKDIAPKTAPAEDVVVTRTNNNGNITVTTRRISRSQPLQTDKPFATTSAACAFDKKHDRLYYTPIGIPQLRYIDLKSGKLYYFEDERFGALKSRHDVANQITRMVIASDGNGYALTNDANHLIRFTTGKKPEITDLGAISDGGSAQNSIHSRNGYGGDMIADAQNNLYLITAGKSVFKISIEGLSSTYLGQIKGLPKNFTTNGAAVDEDSKVIVTSSSSTMGYYRFDLNTLEAEQLTAGTAVYIASDLANGTLAFAKKKKDRKKEEVTEAVAVKQEPVQPATTLAKQAQPAPARNSISIYPNPVTNGQVRLSFTDQPEGRYQVQFLDISGKIISSRQVVINNKVQIVEYDLPSMTAAGNYLMRVVNEDTQRSVVNKLVVQ